MTDRPLLAYYHSFGCKLNFAETAYVSQILAERGIAEAQRGQTPDLVVVNTCSVTELADKKCRQAIRAFARRWPDAAIVVTGCYAQLKPDSVAALPGVAVVAGTDRKLRLAEYVDAWLATRHPVRHVTPSARDITEFTPSCSAGSRTRWLLKVQDGCDYFCTYCTIPFARGRSRSGSIDSLVSQAREAAAAGAREIVLTGVNVGDFGKGTPYGFIDLIRALDEVEPIERFRISSIEPNLLTDEIISFVASSRAFMPHFHVPLQAGSDEVLRLMHRHYDTATFRRRIEAIRTAMPHAFIGVDVIAGARGETDELFAQSEEFIRNLDISRLHVFPYSERPGTRALQIEGPVLPRVRHDRCRRLIELSAAKERDFALRFAGTVRPVLVEHTPGADGTMTGHTDNFLKVSLPLHPELFNTIARVRLDRLRDQMAGKDDDFTDDPVFEATLLI